MPLGLDLNALAAELELRVHGAVEHEVGAISVERRHRWVVRYLHRTIKNHEISTSSYSFR